VHHSHFAFSAVDGSPLWLWYLTSSPDFFNIFDKFIILSAFSTSAFTIYPTEFCVFSTGYLLYNDDIGGDADDNSPFHG